MLASLFRTHRYLLEHTDAPVRRALMDEINWHDRLIGIKGSRGVGKTTFLLQYAKEHFNPDDRRCLYINMNSFYFQGHSLVEFAGQFYRSGGQVLLIDQVFKQPDWSKSLHECYNTFPMLKIVFTGKKETEKVYTRYTGYPGGQRFNTPAQLRKRNDGGERILRHAVKGMLPKGPLGRSLMNNLYIYEGTEHKQEAQQPKAIDINQYK